MAYSPSLYNPYGVMPMPQSNGQIWVEDIEGAKMYPQAPNTTSPPLYLRNENAFCIKTTDGIGALLSLEKFNFFKEELETLPKEKSELYVTKESFDSEIAEIKEFIDSKINAILEAIDGKRIASESTEQSE